MNHVYGYLFHAINLDAGWAFPQITDEPIENCTYSKSQISLVI